MALKTDYKNDKFEGARKYDLVTNSDNTISLVDKTIYRPEGDIFNADDINTTNSQINQNINNIAVNGNAITANRNSINVNTQEINKVKAVKRAAFSAGGWTASAPYTQTISVSGLTGQDSPIIGLDMSDNPSADVTKAREKAFGYVNRAYTGNGALTLRCNVSKPQTAFTVLIKGA